MHMDWKKSRGYGPWGMFFKNWKIWESLIDIWLMHMGWKSREYVWSSVIASLKLEKLQREFYNNSKVLVSLKKFLQMFISRTISHFP